MSPPHVAVVGAGAAGLVAALRAAERGGRVTLLNAHPNVGLKILMSGGTRCNVTHREVSERDFHGGSPAFVRRVLAAFDVEETLAWMRELGVELKLEDTGKYFPVTDDAHTVLDALLAAVRRAGVVLETGARVIRLERAGAAEGARGGAPPDGFRLGIQRVTSSATFAALGVAAPGVVPVARFDHEPGRWLDADRVVLACGGLSFPRTGSDGVGYALAAGFGHTFEPPVPALTPLAADDPWCRELQGLAVESELRLVAGSGKPAVTRGPLLFAHFGYTGPAALDLSRHWHRTDGGGERHVLASFLPGERDESLVKAFVEGAAREPRVSVRSFLSRRLPERLAAALCVETEIDPATRLGQLTRGARAWLIGRTLARPLPVTGTLGYEKAEVTAGGVRLSEVNPSTLESRLAPGLYFCGEILDVEGRLGGFNFQFAWSSGTIAGRAAADA